MSSLTNKIGIGTVQFGLEYGISNDKGKTDLDEARKILNYAKNKRIKTLDTAAAYGNSEEVLGQIGVDNFNVVSKFIAQNKSDLLDSFNSSIKKLNVSSIYGYMAHRPLDVIENVNLWHALTDLKNKGKVKKIGFSFNDVTEIEKILEVNLIPDLIQIPFNYFDHRFESYAKVLKVEGCEIHSRSTFLQGLFFMDPIDLDPFFNPVKTIIKKLQKHFATNNELAKYLLFSVISLPFIDKVIIGVNRHQQLIDNLKDLEESDKPIGFELELIPENILKPNLWPQN